MDQLFRKEATAAIQSLRQRVHWKPGKAAAHLEKRKIMGHLSSESSPEDYNEMIRDLAQKESCLVYLYQFGSERYYAIRGPVGGIEWLVIATRDGRVETAFPPDKIDGYLEKRGFVLIGTIQEVLT
jgi:hypothetical protein